MIEVPWCLCAGPAKWPSMASTGREHMGSQGALTSGCSSATAAATAPAAASGSCTRVAHAGRRCFRCNGQPLRSEDRCSLFPAATSTVQGVCAIASHRCDISLNTSCLAHWSAKRTVTLSLQKLLTLILMCSWSASSSGASAAQGEHHGS